MILRESNWSGAETAPNPLTLRKTLIRTTEFCKNPWPSFSRTIRRRPASKRRLKVKSRWIIGFLLTCALAISANAQENSGVQSAEGPIANLARQNSGDATSPATQLQAPAGLQDAGTYPDRTTNSGYSLVAPAAPRYSLGGDLCPAVVACTESDEHDFDDAVVLAGGARRAARPDRALSRRPAQPGADGFHVPTRGRRGGLLPQAEPRTQRQGARRRACPKKLGPERAVAGRVSQGARDDEREARMDRAPGRRVPRGQGARDGHGASLATACGSRRQPEVKLRTNRGSRQGDDHRRALTDRIRVRERRRLRLAPGVRHVV